MQQVKKSRLLKKYGITKTELLFVFSFTIIPVIHFLLFYVYVNFNGFLMAFQKPVNNGANYVWTTAQFSRVFEALGTAGAELRIAIKNTFLTFGIMLLMFPASIIISYFLYKKIWFSGLFRILYYLPHIISGIVTAFFFKSFVSTRAPFAVLMQHLYGLDYVPSLLADSLFANKMVFLHMIWLGLPGSMILWLGTFSRIPTSVLEYAKMDGVGWIKELTLIILPLIWPTFSLMFMMLFAGMFSASGSVFLLTGGEWKTQTLSNWFFMQVYGANGSATTGVYNYMSAFGLLITVPACIISLVIRFGLTRLVPDVDY